MSETPDRDIRDPIHLGPHLVPGVWKHMLPAELLEMRFPAESRSTCNNCPKIQERGFHPDYRCCTYHPRIPNFLLGFALEDDSTRRLIQSVIADRMATPEGLLSTADQMRQALNNSAKGAFGKLTGVTCRFLDTKKRQCGVYKYRNSVCSTFFCEMDDPKNGETFWNYVQSLAGQVETALSQWVMLELGIHPRSYFDRFDSMASDISRYTDANTECWTDEAQRLLWGKWYDREQAFFLEAANLVRANKDDLFEIAQRTNLVTARKYDDAFRISLPDDLRDELDTNYPTDGVPAEIQDLWYLLKTTHRNLWRPPQRP